MAAAKQAAPILSQAKVVPPSAAASVSSVRSGATQTQPDAAAESQAGEESEAAESPGDVVTDRADSANVWPDERAEAAFISETRGRGEPVAVASPEIVEELAAKPLPSLDEMVKRIPAETRDLLDELFRAKFTAVRRVKKTDLKNGAVA